MGGKKLKREKGEKTKRKENDIFYGRLRMEMSSAKTRSPSVPYPQFMNSCIRAGQIKNADEALHPPMMRNPMVIGQGGPRQAEVFEG